MQNIVKQHPRTDKYNKSGIYQTKCLHCTLKYIGQTGRAFHFRYKEHIQAIRNNNNNSGYPNCIVNIGYKYGIITDIVDITRTHRKGKHLNTVGKYHIYKVSKNNLQMNDTDIDTHNPISRALQEMNTS
jgi:hypothetical protein